MNSEQTSNNQTDISNSQVVYRRATMADIEGIRDILGYYIRNTMATWRYEVMEPAVFEGWIRNHQSPTRPFWIAEKDNQIIGYGCLSDFRSGDGYWPCAENSVYVRPEFAGSGVGSQLMRLILDQGRAAGLKAIVAAIDAENISSIRFHEKFGFYVCGCLKNIGQKKGTWRSLTLMQCDLKDNPVEKAT